MNAATHLPLDQRQGKIWFDGKMVDWQQANIHILSHSLHYASAVFEGERAYNGKIFELTKHSERLLNSAKLINLSIAYSVAEIDAACNAAVAANNLQDAYVRPLAWYGSNELGLATRNNPSHLAIACWQWPSYYSWEQRQKGISLKISQWRRPSKETAPVASKCACHYVIGALARHEAEQHNFDDAMMLDYRGLIAESSGANIFLVRDGQLHTPKPDCVLDGITRQQIIRLATASGIKVFERYIHPVELSSFSEVFISGTAAEVSFVSKIDDFTFTPGQISQTLFRQYMTTVGASVAA